MEVKKYKILMLAQAYPPYEFSEAIVNAKLVKTLMEAGHTVHVISRQSDQYYSNTWTRLWEPLREYLFYVEDLPCSNIQRIWEIAQAMVYFDLPLEGVRWAKKAVKLGVQLHQQHSYDLVLSRMPSAVSHLVACKIKEKTGIPWIANWNDPTDNIRPLKVHRKPIEAFWLNRMVKSMFHKSDWNTFPSHYLWEHYNQKILRTNKKNIKIIPHIGIDGFQSVDSSIQKKTCIRFIHAGNMLANVKSFLLIKALGRLKKEGLGSFEFNVFGVIDEKMPEQVKALDLEREVKIHPSKPYVEMLQELGLYDFLIILEAPYSKGILMLSKLSDYASIQKPILAISPRNGVIADYLHQYGGGILLDNQSEEEIYQGLKKAITTPEQIKASQALQKILSPQTVLQQWEELFEEVIMNGD